MKGGGRGSSKCYLNGRAVEGLEVSFDWSGDGEWENQWLQLQDGEAAADGGRRRPSHLVELR